MRQTEFVVASADGFRGSDRCRGLVPFSWAVIFVCLLGSEAMAAEPLRIATYNLNWGNRSGDQVLNAIEAAKPDVICFQETTKQSEGFLRKHLSETHPYFHSVGHNGRYAGERFAFASNLELTEVTFVPPDAGLFGFYGSKLRHGGTTIQLVNVHLTPFQVKRGDGIREAMAVLSSTEDKHAIEINKILEAIDCDLPTVVAGDFNSLSSFHAPKRLTELGWVDAYASVHDEADADPTWRWPTRPLPLALRIDYIFHSSHFKTLESEIIHRAGSDHSLVVASLECHEEAD